MRVHNLFPTALGIFDLGRDLTQLEIDFIQKQDKRENSGNTSSVDNEILKNPELFSIKKFVEEAVANYFKEIYAPKNETSLRITQSWCNYTEPGQFHHKHTHPNSFVSGVFYAQADKDTDRIYFHRNLIDQLRTPTDTWNAYNSETWWMEAYVGRMYLFPSHLAHNVEAVKGTGTRISLSFNTFPIGNFGEDFSLTGLRL